MNPQKDLEKWYLKNKRELIFRKNKNPYSIWVSEIMLQQTRVNHMLPIYENFMNRYPTIQHLANSTEEDVLSNWKGLGYYSRAINLRLASIDIVENHNGIFPKTLEEILKIKGIGNYTARAILSIAFDLPFAVLDGNVKRVLSRLYNFDKDIGLVKSHHELQILADEFLNKKSPSNHNQAMMELGSLICTQNPNCKICPIQKKCKSNHLGIQNERPVFNKVKKEISLDMLIYIFQFGSKVFLTKNSDRRFFKKIFSLPFLLNGNSLNNEYMENSDFSKFVNENFNHTEFKNFGKHSITHHSLQLQFTQINLSESQKLKLEKVLDTNQIFKWVSVQDLENEFPSSIAKKIKKVI